MKFIQALTNLLNFETGLIWILLVLMAGVISRLVTHKYSVRFMADLTFYASLMLSFWLLALDLTQVNSLQELGMGLPPIIGLPLLASGFKLYAVIYHNFFLHHSDRESQS